MARSRSRPHQTDGLPGHPARTHRPVATLAGLRRPPPLERIMNDIRHTSDTAQATSTRTGAQTGTRAATQTGTQTGTPTGTQTAAQTGAQVVDRIAAQVI